MRLSVKIAVLIFSFSALFGVSAALLLQWSLQDSFNKVQKEWVSTLVKTIAEGVSYDVINRNTLSVREKLKLIVGEDEALNWAYVVDFDGKIFAHTFAAGFPRFLLQNNSSEDEQIHGEKCYSMVEGDVHDVSFQLLDGMRAYLHVGVNQNEIENVISETTNSILAVLLLVSLFAASLALQMGRRLSRPLSQLSKTMGEYGRGDRNEPVDIKGSDTEVKELVATFNNMIDGRARLEAELNESQAYNRMLFETSPVGLALCTMDGRLADINPAYAEIVGRTVDEAKHFSFWQITPENYADSEKQLLDNLNSHGRYGPYEKEFFHKDGCRIPVRLSGQIVERGGERFILSSVEDITDSKKLKAELQYQNEHLEELVVSRTSELLTAKEAAECANKAKSEFLSSMSHELRTPLNAILGFGQLLTGDPLNPLKDLQRESVGEILIAGKHLLALINDILDLSQIETGKLEISLESVHLADVVSDCLKLTQNQAQERGIEIIDETAGSVLKADYRRVKQVLLNLLSNAIKYNKDGGQVFLASDLVCDQRVRISVTDTGFGISEKLQPKLFRPFERLNAKDNVEGAGIGLVICKQLIELMGGTIGVTSNGVDGSTFWIELELAQGLDMAGLENETSKAEMKTEQAKGRTVLYVEDNLANLKLMKSVFALRPQLKLLSVTDARQGLKTVEMHRPDLILLDINLPDMDGYEMLHRLRGKEHSCHIPVIAVSANAMLNDVQRGKEAGFVDYVTKPIDVPRLLRLVDEVLAANVGE